MQTTHYTEKELRAEAVRAIREDARAAHVRARYLGYTLIVGFAHGPTLQAHGERQDGYQFDVNVAI